MGEPHRLRAGAPRGTNLPRPFPSLYPLPRGRSRSRGGRQRRPGGRRRYGGLALLLPAARGGARRCPLPLAAAGGARSPAVRGVCVSGAPLRPPGTAPALPRESPRRKEGRKGGGVGADGTGPGPRGARGFVRGCLPAGLSPGRRRTGQRGARRDPQAAPGLA